MQITKGKTRIILPLRYIVYFCLSLSLIFLSGLLETKKTAFPSANTIDEVLFLTRHAKPVQKLSIQNFEESCGSNAVKPDDPVKVHYVSRLKSNSIIPISKMDWNTILDTLFNGRQDRLCFEDHDVIYAVSAVENSSYALMEVQLEEVGTTKISENSPAVDANHLEQYQEIKTFLLDIDSLADSEYMSRLRDKPVPIDLQDWKTFTGSIPGLEYPRTTFLFGNHLYSAVVKTEYRQCEEEITELKKQYLVTGSLFLVIGLVTMSKLYRSVIGIRLLPNQLAFILDLVMIIILAVLGFMAMDHLLAERYGMESIMGREGLLGGVSYVLLLLIMPIFVSWQAARGIVVNDKGILDSDLLLQTFMAWDEIKSMELMDDVEFSGRRRSFKVLFIHTVDGNAITISGNIRAKAKKEIKTLLLEHVPEERKHEMKMLLGSL